MFEEQQKTVEIFRTHLLDWQQEKIVLYGTGINAEAVVKSCPEYQIVGLMDAAKTGEVLWGLTVLSEKEILEKGIRCIVVVARPAVLSVIYKRIQIWSEENKIFVCDIYGNSLADRIKDRKRASPYFEISYDMLLEKIRKHEVISFDIFDTLLTRNVYEPRDVFSLLDIETRDKLSFRFSRERIKAERELLLKGEPNIYQIYNLIKEQQCLSVEKTQNLLENEIEKEKEVLLVRYKIWECFQYCLVEKKKIYLVSDMYFTKKILEEILTGLGIDGYEEILVSCEYGCSKQNGLFEILKEKIGEHSWLHIGDNHEADYLAAQKSGGDVFEILSPVRMMELSTYYTLLADIKSTEERVMIGMLAAKVFNDPFKLYRSDGKPRINNLFNFGYVFIAPAIVSFMLWLFSVLEEEKNSLLIFSARDGWLLQKIYHIFQENCHMVNLPEDVYLLISRKAVCIAAENNGCEEERYNYLNYLKSLKLENYKKIYFFDFMSRGTCQSRLEDIIGRKLQGVYFQKSLSGDEKKDSIQVLSFYKEKSALEKDLRIFAMCDFLECILTSPVPSFCGIDCSGNPVYEKEQRSAEQIESIEKIHEGILNYCREFTEIVREPQLRTLVPEFCDKILRCTESSISKIEISELLEFELDDITAKKNTGRDVLT